MATAMERLLQGAARTLLRAWAAMSSSLQSTTTASNLRRVSLRTAASASLQNSTAISRSLRIRRSTLVVLSSEHRTRACKLIADELHLTQSAANRGSFPVGFFFVKSVG